MLPFLEVWDMITKAIIIIFNSGSLRVLGKEEAIPGQPLVSHWDIILVLFAGFIYWLRVD